jgi:translocator protein
MNLSTILRLLFYISICLIIGSSGAYFTSQSINTWYPTLIKPSFNPPNYLFGPVWTSIFILLGICLWGILKTKEKETKTVLNLFILQFIFNILWSYFFFGLRSPGLAMLDILLLLTTLFFFIYHLSKIAKWLAYTQLLYLAWVLFASILNGAIYFLN